MPLPFTFAFLPLIANVALLWLQVDISRMDIETSTRGSKTRKIGPLGAPKNKDHDKD